MNLDRAFQVILNLQRNFCIKFSSYGKCFGKKHQMSGSKINHSLILIVIYFRDAPIRIEAAETDYRLTNIAFYALDLQSNHTKKKLELVDWWYF